MHEHMQNGLLLVETIKKRTREISTINQALERVRTLIGTLTGMFVRAAVEEETGENPDKHTHGNICSSCS